MDKGMFSCVIFIGLKKAFDTVDHAICDPQQDFNAKGESTRTTRFHFKQKNLF